MNYYRYEVTIKDLNGFPHTHYEYHHDLDACRAEREAAIKELGDMSSIGPIQQSEMHIWRDLEGDYQSGTKPSVAFNYESALRDEIRSSLEDFNDFTRGLQGRGPTERPFPEESSTVMTPAELAEETKRAINRASWSSNGIDSKSEE